jgi:hypothetical protein
MIFGKDRKLLLNIFGSVILKGLSLVVGLANIPIFLGYFTNQNILGVWFAILSVLAWILAFDLGVANSADHRVKYNLIDGSRCMFSRHLLPCGWASWVKKYLRNNDGNLEHLEEASSRDMLRDDYKNKRLLAHRRYSFKRTKYLAKVNPSASSLNQQIVFAIRKNNLLGIPPEYE